MYGDIIRANFRNFTNIIHTANGLSADIYETVFVICVENKRQSDKG
jgi:hypothetical protein